MRLRGKLIKRNSEFIEVYRRGKTVAGKYTVLYFCPNKEIIIKAGVSASKKVGNSVLRHRLKRIYKEIFRLNYQQIKTGFNLVIVVRKAAVMADYDDLNKDILFMLKKARLLK